MDSTHFKSSITSYVETIMGRKRKLNDINSRNAVVILFLGVNDV
jgi:DNA polymerase I-like protein with 3'-5' exonuclease and polymerase domains